MRHRFRALRTVSVILTALPFAALVLMPAALAYPGNRLAYDCYRKQNNTFAGGANRDSTNSRLLCVPNPDYAGRKSVAPRRQSSSSRRSSSSQRRSSSRRSGPGFGAGVAVGVGGTLLFDAISRPPSYYYDGYPGGDVIIDDSINIDDSVNVGGDVGSGDIDIGSGNIDAEWNESDSGAFDDVGGFDDADFGGFDDFGGDDFGGDDF